MDETRDEDFTMDVSFSSSMALHRFYPLHIVSKMDPSEFILDFSTMSDEHFKQLLSAHPLNNGSETNFLNKYFHIEENLVFVRQLFHLINKFNYFKLQYEQWTHYYNLGLNEGIWHGRVSSKMAQWNSMSSTYGRKKFLIKQRRRQLEEQLQIITNQVQQQQQQQHQQQQSPANIDIHYLTAIVTDIIENDQYQLRIELERRRHILVFDAKDHELVEAFYKLKPRTHEIRSAQIIWKATHDEQELLYELAIFKLWLSRTRSVSFRCTFEDLALQNINSIVAGILFNVQLSLTTTTTNNSFNNEKLTGDDLIQSLAQQTISATETLVKEYMQKILDEKEKLLGHLETTKNPISVHAIINSIGTRQINMIQRAKYNIEQRLKAFSHNE